ncbi:hypothetical protein ElyMa_002997200 [Elysia marginata]|uniref:Uncharacterized protein n=1 Tax=Elysia marginata TaxID=1093978 RepID=A0AAV4IDN1_9GAST|nr:hypothetical protein ElyMa_002997200 [Elysia marginata]
MTVLLVNLGSMINKGGGVGEDVKIDTESPSSLLRAKEDMVQQDHKGKDKDKNLQLKCKGSPILVVLRSRDMANQQDNTSETTSTVLQQQIYVHEMRRIISIHWPEIISYTNLGERT